MTEEVRKIDMGASRKKVRTTNLQSTDEQFEHPVSFIDAKGRIWTVELDLPGALSMETIREIAKSNISLMNTSKSVHANDLVVLVEPVNLKEFLYCDTKRVVIMHKKKLDSIEGS
jgi:hypothetical protein